VIGDGQRWEFELMRLLHQPVETAGAIEQRILGVQVKVDKFSVRHHQELTARRLREARMGCSHRRDHN
jgi:hypothetical protein